MDAQGGSPANLVNTSVLTPIVDAILAMNTAPKVVIFGDDAAFTGGTANLTYFKTLFTDRLTAAGIPSTVVIGNHELYTQSAAFINEALSRQQDFQALFNSTWTQNGPAGAPLQCSTPTCGPVYPGDVLALQYNYTTVSINGRYVTVSVLDQNNQFIDWFQFFDNSGVNNAKINNKKKIAPDPTEEQPTGILADSHNTITNSASIRNVATGIDAVSDNKIKNSGNIKPLSGGNGIHVYDNNNKL